MSENTPVGDVVFTLHGTDPENSTVSYGLTGTDLLKVNSHTGEVIVAKPFNYEVKIYSERLVLIFGFLGKQYP